MISNLLFAALFAFIGWIVIDAVAEVLVILWQEFNDD